MNGTRILIVEDESIISRDISERLRSQGYEVVGIETSGEGAVRRAEDELPDLVLMDIELQGKIDGIEAAGKISSTFNIPVIFLTAYTDDGLLERAKATEPFGYIIKPFEDRELIFNIEMAVIRHRANEEINKTRAHYQSLLEGLGAIPWEFDLSENRFTYVGPQAERFIGYPVEEWSNLESWVEKVHPEYRTMVMGYYTNASEAESHSQVLDYRVLASDGNERWIRDILSVARLEGAKRIICGFMLDITSEKHAEEERERLIEELQAALAKIKTLRGLLPICAWCKKIRDDKGYWTQVETYVKDHSDAEFTHGICPECHKKLEVELEKRSGTDPP